jgi:hypothetical protein
LVSLNIIKFCPIVFLLFFSIFFKHLIYFFFSIFFSNFLNFFSIFFRFFSIFFIFFSFFRNFFFFFYLAGPARVWPGSARPGQRAGPGSLKRDPGRTRAGLASTSQHGPGLARPVSRPAGSGHGPGQTRPVDTSTQNREQTGA